MKWLDRNRIPDGHWPLLPVAHSGLCNIEEALIADLDLTEGGPDVLITCCMEVYRQAVMRRAIDLAQSAVVCWNAGSLVGAIVSSRSLLETIATYHSFLTRATAVAAVGDWETIGKLTDAYSLSSSSGPRKRQRTLEDPPRVTQVVKEFIQATQLGKEQFWEQICDTAHPNGKRMVSYAGAIVGTRFVARAPADNESVLFVAMYNALYSCCWLIASDLDFDILLECIRTGAELRPDHPLILKRNLVNSVTLKATQELVPPRRGIAPERS